MAGAQHNAVFGRRCFIALASLALLIQVLVPPGFMVSANAGAPSLVICTGHGPLLVADVLGKSGKTPKSTPDAPCGFAAHGASAPPPSPLWVRTTPVRLSTKVIAWTVDAAPGRGLAAPPPQSHAPPAFLI